jgi:hypothetical protein
MTARGIVLAALLAGAAAAGCSSSHPATCSNNNCQPSITLQYRTPIEGDYQIFISLLATTYQSSCPMGPSGPGTGDAAVSQITCDANGAVLTGVDLGNGDNETLDLIVAFGPGATSNQFMVTARLSSISNDRSCELICFQHSGTVAN